MFSIKCLAAASLLLLAAFAAHAAAFELPLPPQQQAEWPPPKTTLPAEFVRGTELVFQCGFADPRGCEYRHITIRTGRVAPGMRTKTEGWLIPSTGERRFAVCWNGAVYPVLEVGEPADLEATIARAIDQAERKFARGERADPGYAEAERVYTLTNQWLKLCMLLRLGKTELADDYFKRTWMPDRSSERALLLDAGSGLFQQAENAHLRGDDDLALPAIKRYAEFLKARGKLETFESGPLVPPEVLRLIADQERRSKERRNPRPPIDQPTISKLIADLENVTGDGRGWERTFDAHEQALLDRREEAIGPLLDCLENDDRLTRSVFIAPGKYGTAEVQRVSHAAFELLVQLLDPNVRYPDNLLFLRQEWIEKEKEASRQELGRLLRAYARETQGLTVPQKWRYVLADDHAPPQQWVRAADRLVNRKDGIILRPGEPLPGEVLRRETAPSVTELVQRRVRDIAMLASDPQNRNEGYRYWDEADDVMKCLVQWDADGARPLLKEHWTFLMNYQRHSRRYAPPAGVPLRIGRFALERIELRDEEGMADYAAWLAAQDPKTLDYLKPALAPLMQHPDDPAAVKLTEQLFLAKDSLWNPLLSPTPPVGRDVSDVVGSPLLGVPAFRKQLLEQLANEQVVRELTVKPAEVQGVLRMPSDPRAAPVGAKIKVRVCDSHAEMLARAPGTPNFQVMWTLEHRNAAIQQLRKLLERYGDRYRRRPHQHYAGEEREEWPWFETLPEPATEEDVAAGRAIFSLRSLGRVRQVAHVPGERATWFTSRQEPYRLNTGVKQVVAYSNRGRIWQAEEVLVDRKWRRYYGFVGDHGFFQVPAEEIEFNDATTRTLCEGLRYELVFPNGDANRPLELIAGAELPLLVQLKVHNYRAVPQTVPQLWLRKEADETRPRWRQGVELRLMRGFHELGDPTGLPFQEELAPLPLKSYLPMRGEPTHTIPSRASLVVAEFDLRDFYSMEEPGRYVLHFTLPGRKTWRDADYSTHRDFLIVEKPEARK